MFEITYANLPPILFHSATPASSPAPTMIAANNVLGKSIGLAGDWLGSLDALAALSGNAILPQSNPIAMAYSGHQFGGWNPSLGDGRAILIGEVVGPDGVRRDLHLKGAGRTAYSRGGDGKASLGAMLREYIVSEAMHALGIPTTRSLAVVATGEMIMRDGYQPGAILTRVAKSHVRVGTFQYLSARGEDDAMRQLADYEIARNFPGAPVGPERYLWFLAQVIARQATLIAKWMSVGFIHGVMNTDNMSVCGETIDYGPCAFMDQFHPKKTFSSIDQNGRYAWDQQPVIALWNLTRLAEAMLPLFAEDRAAAIELAQKELQEFMPAFEKNFEALMAKKLGLMTPQEGEAQFIAATFQHMMETSADYTLFFSSLNTGEVSPSTWRDDWHQRLEKDGGQTKREATMRAANPTYIPRNHRVEEAIAAANTGDFAPLNRLVSVIADPFDPNPKNADFTNPPTPEQEVQETFCGT